MAPRARSSSARSASTSCISTAPADPAGRRGFRRIEAGPDHPPYGLFCVAPGHQLGFNDLKAIEVARFVDAIAGRRDEPFGFRAGLRIQELVEAIQASARESKWLRTG